MRLSCFGGAWVDERGGIWFGPEGRPRGRHLHKVGLPPDRGWILPFSALDLALPPLGSGAVAEVTTWFSFADPWQMDRIRDDPDRAPKINDLCDPRESRKPVTAKKHIPVFSDLNRFSSLENPPKSNSNRVRARKEEGGPHYVYQQQQQRRTCCRHTPRTGWSIDASTWKGVCPPHGTADDLWGRGGHVSCGVCRLQPAFLPPPCLLRLQACRAPSSTSSHSCCTYKYEHENRGRFSTSSGSQARTSGICQT